MIASLPLGAALRRAPVPALAAVLLGVALLRSAEADFDIGDDALLAAAAAGFFGAAAGQGLARSAGAVAVAALAAGAVLLAEPLMVTRWLLVAALALGMLVAPAATRRRTAEESWRILVRTTTAAGLGLLGAAVVIGGVVLIALSADLLLGLGGSDLAWTVVTPLALGWLAPAVFLSLSEGERDDRVAEALGLVARTFARLVLTPLLALYAVVLVLYIARNAAAGALPSGEIGWIVPLFGAAGAVTVLAIASLPEKGLASRLFLRSWFPVTLGPVALYFIAVGIRVDAYGITPGRYLAILVGAWLGMLAVAFTLAPRGDVRLVPVTLVLVLALGAVGPWSLKPVVVASLAGRIADALPPGGAAAVAALPYGERPPVCSPVGRLEALGELARAEKRIGAAGLGPACTAPWAAPDEERIALGSPGAIHVPAEGRVWVSGPYWLYGNDERTEPGAPLSIRLRGASLTVRAGEVAETFDLAAIARAWQAAGGEAPYVVRQGPVTIAIRELIVRTGGAAERTEQATVLVVVPRP